MASTEQEDFSFPIITETHPPSIDSPPLWHLSPAASPNHHSCSRLPNEEYYKQRKSCSNIESQYKNTEDEDEEEEDKMDILWEDYFNEERSNMEGNKRNSNINSLTGDMVELGCVPALKLSKKENGGAILSAAKKPSIVVFIKVLKKLFLLHNSSHHNHSQVKNNKTW